MNVVNLRHPGYDDADNILLTLQAPDDPDGGIHHETARIACGILAGSCWDGFLSVDRSNPEPATSDDGILRGRDYYFHLPNGRDSDEDVSDERTDKGGPYPVTARFQDWRFPKQDLPPLWSLTRDCIHAAKGDAFEIPVDEDGDSLETACRLCGTLETRTGLYLWPPLFEHAFQREQGSLSDLVYSSNFEETDQRTVSEKLHDSVNIVRIGDDCSAEVESVESADAFNSHQFVFVPKFEHTGSPTLSAHIFAPVDDDPYVGISTAHNKPMWLPETVNIELLFARFARSVFSQLGPFLTAEVERSLRVTDVDGMTILIDAEPTLCAALEPYAIQHVSRWRGPVEYVDDIDDGSKVTTDDDESTSSQAVQDPEEVEDEDLEPEIKRNYRWDAVCDGCEKTIQEKRYKCLDCDDFDYGSNCFGRRDMEHPGHRFLDMHETPTIAEVRTGRMVRRSQTEDVAEDGVEDGVEDEADSFSDAAPESQPCATQSEMMTHFLDAGPGDVNPYQYEPLSHVSSGVSHFRIFVLQPGEDYTPIVGHLEVYPLDGCPPYEALSYQWGSDTRRYSALVSDAELEMTCNLKIALHYLRHKHEPRTLWVDAICINQHDNTEKSQQVGIMRDIYRGAQRSVIWLGEEADDSGRAFEMCQRLAIAFMDEDFNAKFRSTYRDGKPNDTQNNPYWALYDKTLEEAVGKSLTETSHDYGDPDSVSKLMDSLMLNTDDAFPKSGPSEGDIADDSDLKPSIDSKDPKAWLRMLPTTVEFTGLRTMFKRPWFSRIWIVQEISVATAAIVQCGTMNISWETLVLGFAVAFYMHPTANKAIGHMRQVDALFGTRDSTVTVRQLEEEAPPSYRNNLHLLRLLQRFRRHQATNPSDKVYALLGISTTDLSRTGFVPDYSRSVRDTYEALATGLLSLSDHLDVLAIARGKTELAACLPSWVPDWSDDGYKATLLSENGQRLDNETSDWPIRVFSASGQTTRPPVSIAPGGQLRLQGYVFDHFQILGSPYILEEIALDVGNLRFEFDTPEQIRNSTHSFKRFISNFNFLSIIEEWERLAIRSDKTDPYPTSEDDLSVYKKTLWTDLDDSSMEQFISWRTDMNMLAEPMTSLLATAADLNEADDDVDPMPLLLGFLSVFEKLLPSLKRMREGNERNSMIHITHRRLARTKRGYLALVPAEAEQGDEIALLMGGRTPFVLRPKNSNWELVGEAYVHGVMYGQQWDENRCHEMILV